MGTFVSLLSSEIVEAQIYIVHWQPKFQYLAACNMVVIFVNKFVRLVHICSVDPCGTPYSIYSVVLSF